MPGTDTADMVPGKYDVIIDGYGYCYLDSLESSIPFRTHRAIYGQTQPFVERQNVSNSYGDNAQDFFLTIRQRDWSQGEQQRFFRAGVDGRDWTGLNVDVSTPGRVRLASKINTVTFAASVRACARDTVTQKLIAASSTKLYSLDSAGAIVDNGAHGLGANPSKFGLANDGVNDYVTTLNASTVGVRKWTGAAYTTFSATASDSLIFLNNTLYGYRGASGDLGSYDGTGTFTSLFTWKDATNTAYIVGGGSSASAVLEAFGGKILILFPHGQFGSSLWIYDGTGASLLQIFPPNYLASDIEVLYGVAYIGGSFFKAASTSTQYNRPALHFYDGSQIGLLWQANDYNTAASSDIFGGPHPALVAANGRLFFTDDTMSTLLNYDPASGAISTVGSYSAGGTDARLAATGFSILHTRNGTGGYYTGNSTFPTSGSVSSSLIDFDSSLPKQLRGVTIEWDAASDGDGGSVDVAYQLNSLDGAYTALASGVTSGTETVFPANTSAHAVSIKVTINKGTSTMGPVLRSLSVRGAPVMPVYPRGEYILDCTNTVGAPRQLRDQTTFHPLTGAQQVAHLTAARNSLTPITITDRVNGTYVGQVDVNDPEGFDVYEVHPAPSYVVRLTTRGV